MSGRTVSALVGGLAVVALVVAGIARLAGATGALWPVVAWLGVGVAVLVLAVVAVRRATRSADIHVELQEMSSGGSSGPPVPDEVAGAAPPAADEVR